MTDLQIQLLAYLGYDPGTLDGIMGKNTRAAEPAQNKLDVFYAVDRLTEDEYTELTALAASVYGSESE